MWKESAFVLTLAAACGGCARHPSREPGAHAVVQQTPTGPITLPPPWDTPFSRNHQLVGPRPEGASLRVPPGFRVAEFASGLGEARWMALAPNGDVFATEHDENRVIVLRDADHDGVAESRFVFATGLNEPFGIAFHPSGWLYVANTDGVLRYRYAPGQLAASGAPERIAALPGGGYNLHWTRTILFTPDHSRLLIGVGSETNVDVESDPLRAAISEWSLDGREHRIFANGLRNPVGIAFAPGTGRLFTTVNERDHLGDDLVPDYLTEVHEGAFYGWPWSYYGANVDPRRRGERADMVARAVVPDLALGAHVAAVGLVFCSGPMFPAEYQGDALVSFHGSWNRAQRAGYKVVRVHFQGGRPTSLVTDFLSGWLTDDQLIWGRPVGLLIAADGSLLVADDATHKIWRVAAR